MAKHYQRRRVCICDIVICGENKNTFLLQSSIKKEFNEKELAGTYRVHIFSYKNISELLFLINYAHGLL